jgi:hypothetical protein
MTLGYIKLLFCDKMFIRLPLALERIKNKIRPKSSKNTLTLAIEKKPNLLVTNTN